jgi:hypothetical protein
MMHDAGNSTAWPLPGLTMQQIRPGILSRTIALLGLAVACGACIGPGIPVEVEGGHVALNDTLRRDMGPTVSTPPLTVFSDGNCRGSAGANPNAPCNLVSPVLGSLMHDQHPEFVQRMRKAPNLWVTGGNGFARLSYEIIVEDVTLRDSDEDVVLGTGVSFGSCDLFPMFDQDTREPPAAIRGAIAPKNYADHIKVDVRSCSRPAIPAISTADDLGAVKTNCSSTSVTQLLAGRVLPNPQNPPLCVIDLGAGALLTDVSFSLVPSQREDATFVLEEISPGMQVKPIALPTHLKVVPAGGIRTISRSLTYTGQAEADGGQWIHRYEWRVPMAGQDWQENFSPNITVVAARVRRGNPTVAAGDYRLVEALNIGSKLCKTREESSGHTEFDVTLCEPTIVPFSVSPAYTHLEMAQSPGPGSPLAWQVRLRHDTQSPPADAYHLELDLTAISETGTSGSGLTAAPASRDLGTLRVGLPSPAIDAFAVENFGIAAVRVQSISLTGPHAPEFGQPTTSAGPAPFNLAGQDSFVIRLQPQFTSMSLKNAVTEVRFVDHVGRQGMISMPVMATAVQPAVIAMPDIVRLFATPDAATGNTSAAVRAAILINAGPVSFSRLGVTIDGPDAANFEVVQSEFGSGSSDLSAPLPIGPGESEIYRVRFSPNRIGESTATLLIQTSEGEAVVGLWGICDTGCDEHPDPILLLPLPPPEFEFRKPLFRVLDR